MSSIIGSISGTSGNTSIGSSGLAYTGVQAPLIQSYGQTDAATALQQQQAAQAQQQNFVNATQAQNGLGNQTATFNQLQGIANGTGPNPAQAQLAQSTGANVAQTAAQMAGQRGSGANVGLMARQIGQQGAATQQGAAGQAATLQANQSLNALNSMGSLATNQANQQANAVSGLNQTALSGQSNVLGAIGAQNSAAVGSQSSVNSGQAQIAGIAAQGQQGLLGQLGGALGSIGHLFAEGGRVKMADGGSPDSNPSVGGIAGAVGTMIDPSLGKNAASDFAMSQGGAVPRQMYADGSSGVTELQSNSPSKSDGPQSKVGQFFQNMQSSTPNTGAQPPAQNMGSSMKSGYDAGTAIQAGAKKLYNYFSTPSDPNSMANIGAPLQNMGANVGNGPLQLGTPDTYIPASTGSSGSLTMPNLGATPGASAAGTTADSFTMPSTLGGNAAASAAGNAAATDAAASAAGEVAAEDTAGDAVAAALYRGGKVPALLSPGERYLNPREVNEVAKGKKAAIKAGKKVPGTPKVTGAKNSYANDTIKATLDEGGIVLPRSVTQAKHPAWAAHAFVRDIVAKNGLPKK